MISHLNKLPYDGAKAQQIAALVSARITPVTSKEMFEDYHAKVASKTVRFDDEVVPVPDSKSDEESDELKSTEAKSAVDVSAGPNQTTQPLGGGSQSALVSLVQVLQEQNAAANKRQDLLLAKFAAMSGSESPPLESKSAYEKHKSKVRAFIRDQINFDWDLLSYGKNRDIKEAAKSTRRDVSFGNGLTLRLSDGQDEVHGDGAGRAVTTLKEFSDVFIHFVGISAEFRPERTIDLLKFYRWLLAAPYTFSSKMAFFLAFKASHAKSASWMLELNSLAIQLSSMLQKLDSAGPKPRLNRPHPNNNNKRGRDWGQDSQNRGGGRDRDGQGRGAGRPRDTGKSGGQGRGAGPPPKRQDRGNGGGGGGSGNGRGRDSGNGGGGGGSGSGRSRQAVRACSSVSDPSYTCRSDCHFRHWCSKCNSSRHTIGSCDQ
jgi:hypothetical protein